MVCPRSWLSALCLQLVGVAALALPPGEDDYERLRAHRYTPPVPVPAEGLVLELDTARWYLRSGTVRLLEPIADGLVTGLVFEGDGIFVMKVPDEVELRQLRRFARDDEMEWVEEPFSRMVLRTSDRVLVTLLGELAPATGALEESRLARARHEAWLLRQSHDADSRLIAALRTLGDRYFRADFDTAGHGWLTHEWDALVPEEISLFKAATWDGWGVVEGWLSLDRPEERRADGRPAGVEGTTARLRHLDASVNLTELGKGPPRGLAEAHPWAGELTVRVRYEIRRDGVGALYLWMGPMTRLRTVRRVGGPELDFLRFPTGSLRLNLGNRVFNPAFAVLLDRPLAAGHELELEFDYELELVNYAPGLVWYPTPWGMQEQRHTATLEFRHRANYEISSVGRQIERAVEGSRATTRWAVENPTRMVGFTFGRRVYERRFEEPGLPPVTIFSTTTGELSRARIEKRLPEHVLGPLRYFQETLFDSRLQTPELWVTLIAAAHGQAFEGFIQLDDWVTRRPRGIRKAYGTRELFVAHEVAHQWWGHEVGYRSYRDQWLSEALAEYSALMYIEAELEDGEAVFERALTAYLHELSGSIKPAFNAFFRGGVTMDNRQGRKRMGPIGHGRRAATRESPAAYLSVAYRKGALVLHMARMLLRAHTGDDEAFIAVLRELRTRHRHRGLRTETLREALESRLDYDWETFFDQWVYGSEIPEFRWSHESRQAVDGAAGWLVELEVRQSEVSPGFTSLVPVRAELEGGGRHEELVRVDAESQSFRLLLPARPRKVVFNPDFAVIQKIR